MSYSTATTFLLIFSTFFGFHVVGQSVHQEHMLSQPVAGQDDAAYYESLPNPVILHRSRSSCSLTKTVYGWHPYWVGSAYLNHDFDLLSHFSFFSYEVDYQTGNALTTHGWSTSAAVDSALASGNTKVTLCVTLFSNHASFLTNATARQTLISNLITQVSNRQAHGVNIDFEGIPSSQATNFANFMVDLANQMHNAIPGSEVSTVLYSVDWNNVFDFSIMEPAVDQYIIMGYGYYYSGSSTAGPTDPLYQFGNSYNYTLSKSITSYLDAGCPRSKLILGLPYYGYEWPVNGLTVPASTTGSGTSRTFAYVKNNGTGYYSPTNHQYDGDSFTDIYLFNNGTENRQCQITLEGGFNERLDHINRAGIGGMGIWALGYDNGYAELWDAIEGHLTDCATQPCSGTIFDFGGPTKNYYNDENYTWTIAPPGASSVHVDFSNFNVESNYDYLYIYDGNSIAAPQISGSPFSGTTGPGSFATTSGAVTFRFTSDGATVAPGFNATYWCETTQVPIAQFSVQELTICAGDSILLQSTSQDATEWLWTVDEGTIINADSAIAYLVPSTSGTYSISLEVSNAAGSDQHQESVQLTVAEAPVAGANLNATELTLPGAVLYCTNTSLHTDSYVWNFGDGQQSTDQHPWHAYTDPGVYTVQLIAVSNYCDADTLSWQVTVGVASSSAAKQDLTKVFPNPFEDSITIEGKWVNYRLLDASGKLVAQGDCLGKTTRVDGVSHLATGNYLLILRSEDGMEQTCLLHK